VTKEKQNTIISIGNTHVELLQREQEFIGLGKIWIGDTLVRSGRLPLRPYTQTFTGLELSGLYLIGVEQAADEIRIRLKAHFTPLPVKVMRDHSFDPIHELGDWDQEMVAFQGQLDLVIEPAKDEFNGVKFSGFSYHWEYKSTDVLLFWLLDRASWELNGDITGATAVSQSACSAPVATFDRDNTWSTEGVLPALIDQGHPNPCMTHNLPRWASHGSFDFQYKGDRTLIGVFDHVELIRSVICRDASKPELKHFDKYIFDQALEVKTVPKKILLNTEDKSEIGQQNVWTWIHEDVENRARAEFGLKQEPLVPRIGHNFWRDFTIDSYFKDMLPAAIGIGCKQLFVDNLNKSDMTEGGVSTNMCNGHEYEIAPKLGGPEKLKGFVARAGEHGIQIMSWTNNDQSYGSPFNLQHADPKYREWWVQMEDTRLAYGGAYTNTFTIWDFNNDVARQYWIDSLKKIREETGLNGYLFDSFYNLGFMPVSYRDGKPRTMWRKLLEAFKTLQDADVHFLIESFGPFGQPQHGHPSSYNFSTVFAAYRVGLGNDSSTVPTGMALKDVTPKSAAGVYYALAHMAFVGIPLFEGGRRIDQVWTAEHKQALSDYLTVLPHLHRRILQEDGLGVIWQDATGESSTLFNFKPRSLTLTGQVTDVTNGGVLPSADGYYLEACHTYRIVPAQHAKS